MMSKKLVLLLSCILSVGAAAHTIEFGFENEQFSGGPNYNRSDALYPYVSGSISPVIQDSNLKIDFKYMYQDQYGKERATATNDRFKTERDRFELFASGYTYKNGNFTFAPKGGFRYEQWKINEDNTSLQNQRYLNLRFYPNMTYKLSDATNLYVNGFTGPAFTQTQKEGRKDSDYVKGELGRETHYGDWYQELEVIGVRHKLPNKDAIWASVYNEYKHTESSTEYMRWQLRGGYNWNATEKLTINPFIRYDVSNNEEGLESSAIKGSNAGLDRDKKATRIGTTFGYKIDPTLSLIGEVYWQSTETEAFNGKTSPDKDLMFYKLAIRKTF